MASLTSVYIQFLFKRINSFSFQSLSLLSQAQSYNFNHHFLISVITKAGSDSKEARPGSAFLICELFLAEYSNRMGSHVTGKHSHESLGFVLLSKDNTNRHVKLGLNLYKE